MAGCIVQVWFKPERGIDDRSTKFQIIETEFDDFASFCEAVADDVFIGGAVLWTTRLSDGTNEVRNRQPCAFFGSSVARCALPRWTFVEGK